MKFASGHARHDVERRVVHGRQQHDPVVFREPQRPRCNARSGSCRAREGQVGARDFERERTREVTYLLEDLDATASRLAIVTEADLAAPFQTLERLTQQSFNAFVATNLGLGRCAHRRDRTGRDAAALAFRRARRSAAPAARDDRRCLRSEHGCTTGDGAEQDVAWRTHVHARQRHARDLDDGRRTSRSLRSASRSMAARPRRPIDHRGTADAAIHALQAIAQRGPHAAEASWTFGLATVWANIDDIGDRRERTRRCTSTSSSTSSKGSRPRTSRPRM